MGKKQKKEGHEAITRIFRTGNISTGSPAWPVNLSGLNIIYFVRVVSLCNLIFYVAISVV